MAGPRTVGFTCHAPKPEPRRSPAVAIWEATRRCLPFSLPPIRRAPLLCALPPASQHIVGLTSIAWRAPTIGVTRTVVPQHPKFFSSFDGASRAPMALKSALRSPTIITTGTICHAATAATFSATQVWRLCLPILVLRILGRHLNQHLRHRSYHLALRVRRQPQHCHRAAGRAATSSTAASAPTRDKAPRAKRHVAGAACLNRATRRPKRARAAWR